MSEEKKKEEGTKEGGNGKDRGKKTWDGEERRKDLNKALKDDGEVKKR